MTPNNKQQLSEEKNEEIIDAGKAIKAHRKEHIKGERGAFSLTSKNMHLPLGSKTFILVIIVFIGLIFGAFMYKAWKFQNLMKDNLEGVNNNLIANTLPPLEPRVFKPTTNDETLGNIENPYIELDKEEYQKEIVNTNSVQARKLSSELTTGSSSNNSNNASLEQQSIYDNSNNFKGSNSELQSKLEPLRLTPSVAGKLENRDYLLTQGAIIDCQLETRMITTQPGMTSCYVTRNIYSASGRVILIDRGSKIVGNYQGGITQGQARIFVLWSRIETPKGVIIDLDSLGSGSLGESGVGGNIETHFWQRFGGAIMMSLIGDFGQIVNNRTAKNNKGGNNIQLTNTTQGLQEAAVEALKNSINIPPTLYKNQGERITIFVARDLDFTGVYGLEPE